MVSQVTGNNFNKWFQLNPNALTFGQGPTGQGANPVQNGPVNSETTPVDNYQITQPFAMNVGGVTGPSTVNPVQGVGRTESVGHVTAEDGNTQITMGGQGYGFYTVMEPGAGSHSDPLYGRAEHTGWWCA